MIKKYAADKFVGLSTDPKPENVPEGAEFFETDTLCFYVKVSKQIDKSKDLVMEVKNEISWKY